jgi:hypothetical protein
MKPKFLLAIISINTLFLAGIATASSISPAYNIFKLSQTISKLVGFSGDDPNLVKSAIDRALKAKEEAVNPSQIAGGEEPMPAPSPPKPEQLGGKG